MCIRHKDRNDYLGVIALYDFGQSVAGTGKPAEPIVKVRVVIDPGINVRPNVRRAIDREDIHAPDKLVDWSECFREKIAAFDRRLG